MANEPAEKPTARTVLDGLHGRWPDDQYLFVEEAPQDSMRQGRKIDALVVSLWKSRGHELDAVEVKISGSDWKRELDNPDKADWWWEHTNRYWIAVPAVLAPKVKAELPVAWGLLAVQGGKCQEVVKAPKHAPTPLEWSQTIGIMRAAADAGIGALERARSRGYSDGLEHGRKNAAASTTEGRVQRALDDLTAVVEAFSEASGLDLRQCWGSVPEAKRWGESVALIQKAAANPERMLAPMRRQAATLKAAATGMEATAAHLESVLRDV